jgi:hypothetical protein
MLSVLIIICLEDVSFLVLIALGSVSFLHLDVLFLKVGEVFSYDFIE